MKPFLYPAGMLLTAALAFSSCRNEADIPATPEITFSRDIQPILIANCAISGCHNSSDGEEPALETYEQVMSYGEVEAGNANKSELYRVVANRSWTVMPPGGYDLLDDRQIQAIYIWIEQGAKNN